LASYYSAVAPPPSKRQRTDGPVAPSSPPTIVLLTDDADNRHKAKAVGLTALSVREYVESQSEEVKVALMDLLAADGAGERKKGGAFYNEVSRTNSGGVFGLVGERG